MLVTQKKKKIRFKLTENIIQGFIRAIEQCNDY